MTWHLTLETLITFLEKKSVMLRNFRFLNLTDVENSEISPHDISGEIWNVSTWHMWRNRKFLHIFGWYFQTKYNYIPNRLIFWNQIFVFVFYFWPRYLHNSIWFLFSNRIYTYSVAGCWKLGDGGTRQCWGEPQHFVAKSVLSLVQGFQREHRALIASAGRSTLAMLVHIL